MTKKQKRDIINQHGLEAKWREEYNPETNRWELVRGWVDRGDHTPDISYGPEDVVSESGG